MAGNRLKMSLLPALKALLDAESVTGAAAQMHVTQSTMSRTLAQLRDVLNDPILVREGNHIYLSEKARQLHPEVARLMADAERLFESPVFDPATSEHHFRIGAGSGMQQFFLSWAFARVREKAPCMTFSVETVDPDSMHDMAAGQLDLLFTLYSDAIDSDTFKAGKRVEGEVYFVFRKGHPLAEKAGWSMQELDCYPFVQVASALESGDALAEKLKRESTSFRDPWLNIPILQGALDVVRQTDAFTLAWSLGIRKLNDDPGFTLVPLPAEYQTAKLGLLWPSHWQFNQAHQWLRNFLQDCLVEYYKGDEIG